MRPLLDKYAAKLEVAGLALPGGALLAGLDDELCWNRDGAGLQDPRIPVLVGLFQELAVNSLVCTAPPEPHAGIIRYLARQALERGEACIKPQDCETRTFLHDLPVLERLELPALLQGLSRRKGVIVLRGGTGAESGPLLVALGQVSPEQGFVSVSSLAFACFVKFFADAQALALARARQGGADPDLVQALRNAVAHLHPVAPLALEADPGLLRGPFPDPETVHRALCEAGRAVVRHRLVDSFFGNISCLHAGVLYISQTGSSLDELEGHVDPCPLDGSSTAALTASSELTAHLDALARTRGRTLLHGHPPFCVVQSLDCALEHCPGKGRCHLECSRERDVHGVPIVPGEVGSGPHGLCHTLPPALERHGTAIVHGHGLFAVGHEDFNAPFAELLRVERLCRESCLERLRGAWPEAFAPATFGQAGAGTL